MAIFPNLNRNVSPVAAPVTGAPVAAPSAIVAEPTPPAPPTPPTPPPPPGLEGAIGLTADPVPVQEPSAYIIGFHQTLNTMTTPQEQQNFVQAIREKLLQRLYRYETSKARGLALDDSAQADYDTIRRNLAEIQPYAARISPGAAQPQAPGAQAAPAAQAAPGLQPGAAQTTPGSVLGVADPAGFQKFLAWKKTPAAKSFAGKSSFGERPLDPTWEDYQRILAQVGS